MANGLLFFIAANNRKDKGMNYLKLEPGKTYIMTIAEDKITPRTYHWWKGKSVDCEGEGCLYCRRKLEIRQEGWLDVEIEGMLYRWSFPASVGVKIRNVVLVLLGATISVKLVKQGIHEYWEILPHTVGQTEKPVTSSTLEIKPLLDLMADTLESMAKEIRGIAQKLDGQK